MQVAQRGHGCLIPGVMEGQLDVAPIELEMSLYSLFIARVGLGSLQGSVPTETIL